MPAAETDVSKGYYEDYENGCCESERHEATADYNRGNRGCSSLSLFYNVDAGRRDRLTVDEPSRGKFFGVELVISGELTPMARMQ